jgi:hypothetical protein
MLLREGTAGKIYNAIVTGFKDRGLDIDHQATFDQVTSGDLMVGSSIFWDIADPFSDDAESIATQWGLAVMDPKLINPYSQSSPDFRPQADSPAVDGTVTVASPPNDGFFEQVDFIGGVDPDNDWTLTWTR